MPRWIRSDLPVVGMDYEIRYYDCSECGRTVTDRYGMFKYCPWCGARMEDEDDG